jgi:hypothetical protein
MELISQLIIMSRGHFKEYYFIRRNNIFWNTINFLSTENYCWNRVIVEEAYLHFAEVRCDHIKSCFRGSTQ